MATSSVRMALPCRGTRSLPSPGNPSTIHIAHHAARHGSIVRAFHASSIAWSQGSKPADRRSKEADRMLRIRYDQIIGAKWAQIQKVQQADQGQPKQRQQTLKRLQREIEFATTRAKWLQSMNDWVACVDELLETIRSLGLTTLPPHSQVQQFEQQTRLL